MNTNQTPEEIKKKLRYFVYEHDFSLENSLVDGLVNIAYSEIQSLQNEVERLKYWKEEFMKVWRPVYDLMQNHKDIKLGESISEKVVEFIKERDSMAERNRDLESELLIYKALCKTLNESINNKK